LLAEAELVSETGVRAKWDELREALRLAQRYAEVEAGPGMVGDDSDE
jgi:hypothetical protein